MNWFDFWLLYDIWIEYTRINKLLFSLNFCFHWYVLIAVYCLGLAVIMDNFVLQLQLELFHCTKEVGRQVLIWYPSFISELINDFGFSGVLWLRVNRDFREVVTWAGNSILWWGLRHLSGLGEAFQMGSAWFWGLGPPVALSVVKFKVL